MFGIRWLDLRFLECLLAKRQINVALMRFGYRCSNAIPAGVKILQILRPNAWKDEKQLNNYELIVEIYENSAKVVKRMKL